MLDVSAIHTADDLEVIKSLYLGEIPRLYPLSGQISFAAILACHNKGEDTFGYFTKRKTIWSLKSESGSVLGFSVVTEKRGGCIKFGPTVIHPSVRNRGLGRHIRSTLETIYARRGYRKAYSTTNVSNLAGIRYLLPIGYRIEIHMRDHYVPGSDELVLGKFLESVRTEGATVKQFAPSVPGFVAQYFEEYFSETDEAFFRRIDSALVVTPAHHEKAYVAKQKMAFANGATHYALAVPKRGGAVKLCPLILSDSITENRAFVERVMAAFDGSFHKFYALIPYHRSQDHVMLGRLGFQLEGIIHAPYRVGTHLLVFSIWRKR